MVTKSLLTEQSALHAPVSAFRYGAIRMRTQMPTLRWSRKSTGKIIHFHVCTIKQIFQIRQQNPLFVSAQKHLSVSPFVCPFQSYKSLLNSKSSSSPGRVCAPYIRAKVYTTATQFPFQPWSFAPSHFLSISPAITIQ